MLLTKRHTTRVNGAEALRCVGVVVPTWNARPHWRELRSSLDQQCLQPEQILIIDSSSTDGTADLARRAGYSVAEIPHGEFNHSDTRNAACALLPSAEILVMLTQDAVPVAPDCIETLCQAFQDPIVGAAYGRQLPRPDAKAIERHARLFNYTSHSQRRRLEDRETLGLKAAFLSNSFAAYRRTALDAIGGFPQHVIVSEDLLAGARMLMAGWELAYVADATVIHSHGLSLRQEIARYFDIGVNHARESWLLDAFGGATDEGRRFVRSEWQYLIEHDKPALPGALFRSILKWASYKAGRNERRLPLSLKLRLSSHPNFWKSPFHHE